jgi:hypothetical protein
MCIGAQFLVKEGKIVTRTNRLSWPKQYEGSQ